MPPQLVNPLVLGIMALVAVGTVIFTFMTSNNREPQYDYQNQGAPRTGQSGPRTGQSGPRGHGNEIKSSKQPPPDPPSPSRTSKKKDPDQCCICQEDLSPIMTLRCGHRFHRTCITRWIPNHNTCPLCRQSAE